MEATCMAWVSPEPAALSRWKVGAVSMLLGIFLGAVGTVFTIMGWLQLSGGASLQWKKLMGPVMLCAGGGCVLVSACSFRVLRHTEEEEERGASEAWPRPSAFHHPVVMFHCATVATQLDPPPYDSLFRTPPGPALGGGAPPSFCSLFPGQDAALSAEGGPPLTRPAGSRVQEGQRAEGKDKDNRSTCVPPPPAYKDI